MLCVRFAPHPARSRGSATLPFELLSLEPNELFLRGIRSACYAFLQPWHVLRAAPRRVEQGRRDEINMVSRCAIRVAIGLAVIGLLSGSARAELVDSIMASVDNEPILQSDVMLDVSREIAALQQSLTSEEAFNRRADDILRRALDDAINSKMLLREAQLTGVSIKEDAIEVEVRRIREGFDSNEEFLKALEQSGETLSDLRERMRKQALAIVMRRKKQEQFEKEIVVSESELAQYYEDHRGEFQRPERVRARQIYLSVDTDADRAKVRARAEALRAELATGAAFGELAKAHSELPGAEGGGLVGWVAKGDFEEDLERALFALEAGQYSEVLDTAGGYSILYVEEKQSEGLATLDEARSTIEPKLREQAAQARYERWLAEVRKASNVQVFF